MKQWDAIWKVYRRQIVFAKSSAELAEAMTRLESTAQELCLEGEKQYAAELICNIYIDINSSLTAWVLDKNVTPSQKQAAIAFIKELMLKIATEEQIKDAEQEVTSIKNSQFAKIAALTDKGELFTYWGNDLCTGVDFSLRRGASFTTSNPSKINLFRQAEPEQYAAYVKEVMDAHPGLSKEKILSYVTVKVVAQVARKLKPINEATDGKFGVSFTQVSPFTWNDAVKMRDEVLLWYSEFQKELNTDKPNVVFKMPATPAAKKAVKDLLEHKDIRVTLTSNFAAGQHEPFYELVDKRQPNCFLVIVDCHLRKFAKPEFEALGVANPDYYCEKLVWAVYQKCYKKLLERDSFAMVNGAGMREDVGIRLCLTKESKLPYTLTVTPTLAADFDSMERDMSVIWDTPISDEDMEILNKSSIFRRAYYEDEFPWDNIQSFEPYKFMMDGFEVAHNACLDALPEYEK
ncbi:MAG: hypothetical protein IJC24_03635 [Clostridia bacterium]|nr:hypothetical protein [Clostridia bacterium]